MEENSEQKNSPGVFSVFLRGVAMRCPRCGEGKLYQRWNILEERCDMCGYGFEEREGDCWFFLYSTTAALTGIFIIIILLWRPEHMLLGRILLGVTSACVIALSLPVRKGIALALDYISDSRGGNLLLYEEPHQKN